MAKQEQSEPKVLLYQTKDAAYLPLVLKQLRRSNPHVEIVILGNERIRKRYQNITFVPYQDYSFAHQLFDKTYFHLSSLSEEFERFCIQRWFAIHAYMEEQNLAQALYLDSDVLVYADLNELFKQIDSPGMTRLYNSAHTNLIQGREVLGQFCHFIEQHYQEEEGRQKLRRYTQELHHKTGKKGGVSDMTFVDLFGQANPEKVKDLGESQENFVVDTRITHTEGYIKEGPFKKLIWKKGKPHCQTAQGEVLPMATLHCQGIGKRLIPQLVQGPRLLHSLWQLGKKAEIKFFGA